MTYDNDDITGAGGSCFPAGTKINTPLGYRNIEELKVGDEVYGFHPRTGNVSIERITETYKHTWEEGKDTSPLIILDYSTGCLCITKNHWIYRKNKRLGEYANFDEAGEFQVGDVLTTEYGEEVVITKITPGPEYDFVYNLETTTHHTFIAAKIRVHNGGGGKKKQKAHVHYEAPNDLRSKSVVRVLEVISEGEIVGLVNGAKSVYFDSTPVQNEDGTYNFGSVTMQQRYGIPSQDPVPGFPLVEAEKAVNVEVKYGTPIARAMTETGNTACRVTISLPEGLYKQDTTNGDLFGYEVSISIEHRVPSGIWVHARSDTITGKTMGVYERSYRIEAPSGNTGLWEVRVLRTTAESKVSDIKDKVAFARLTEIKDLCLPYNNTAYMAGTVDAESTGGALPVRSYDCKGLVVKVPTNYTVATRTYSGTWNGTFTPAWTDNPAWVLYDLLTNTRYGLGEFIKDYNVDKYSFYNAAVYNDVLVNDGQGTGLFAPRYTFNGQIMQQDESWQILQAVASCMRATLYIGGGIVKLVQDRPGSAVKLVSKANVIDGMFNYSSTTARDRHTAVNVTYNDPNDNWLPKIITMEDAAGIARYGYNKMELAAYGCTSENQARRLGRWALETELRTTEQVSYKTSFAQLDLQPGDIIKLMDDDYASTIQAGKVVSATSTSITVDKTVTIANGTLDLVSSDGKTIISKALTNGANGNVLTWVGAITPTVPWSDWMITAAVSPRLFRVISVKEVEPAIVEITAAFYDEGKYARVEAGTYMPTVQYFTPPSNIPVGAVQNITWTRQSFTNANGKVTRFLRIGWSPRSGDFITSYSVKWQRGSEDWKTENTQTNAVQISAEYSGLYSVIIYAYSAYAAQSPAATSTYTLDLTGTGPSSTFVPVTNLRVSGTTGAVFEQRDCVIEWDDPNVNNPAAGVTVQDYEITVRDATTATLVIYSTFTTTREFNYTFSQNNADTNGVPRRTFIIQVRVRDTFNRYSAPANRTFTNPAPPAPILTLTPGVGVIWVDIKENPAKPDTAGYMVFMGTSTNFIPSEANRISRGFTSSISVQTPSDSIRYFIGAVYDDFSEALSGLNFSTKGSATSIPNVIPNEWQVEGLTFRGNSPGTNQISWTACTVYKTAGRTGKGTTVNIPAGSATWTADTLYVYYKEGSATLLSSATITEAIGETTMVLATYKGGTNVSTGNGKFFVDGANIYAGTIGATQLVAGQAVITGTAQLGNAVVGTAAIGSAVINSSHIQDAVITTAKIQDATITTAKIQDASITTAKIADASITSAKIGNAQIGNAQIADTISSTNFASGSTGWAIRRSDGAAEFQNVTARGNITANALSAATGEFKGMVNVGSYTGYAWPAAGNTGVHLSSNGILCGNSNGGGKYFQIHTPAGGNAAIYTNIPAYIETAQIQTLHVGNGSLSNSAWIANGGTVPHNQPFGIYSENDSKPVTYAINYAFFSGLNLGTYTTPNYSGMPGSIPTLCTCIHYLYNVYSNTSVIDTNFKIYYGSNVYDVTGSYTMQGGTGSWVSQSFFFYATPGMVFTPYYYATYKAVTTIAGSQGTTYMIVGNPRIHFMQTWK